MADLGFILNLVVKIAIVAEVAIVARIQVYHINLPLLLLNLR